MTMTRALSDSPVAYYPSRRAKWDHRAGTIRLDHLDNLLTDNINPKTASTPASPRKSQHGKNP